MAVAWGGISFSLQADILEMQDGSCREGKILSIDANYIRMELPPPEPHRPSLILSEPRDRIKALLFSMDEDFENLLTHERDMGKLQSAWFRFLPFISEAHSPAGRIGNVWGEELARSKEERTRLSALSVFRKVETLAWDSTERERAQQKRLEWMLNEGRFKDAYEEVLPLSSVGATPAIRAIASLIIGSVFTEAFREFTKENPRWEEDVRVRDKREQLYRDAVEWHLRPALLLGVEAYAARGLWGALENLERGGESTQAIALAYDLLALYPDSPEAEQAKIWLESIPSENASEPF